MQESLISFCLVNFISVHMSMSPGVYVVGVCVVGAAAFPHAARVFSLARASLTKWNKFFAHRPLGIFGAIEPQPPG